MRYRGFIPLISFPLQLLAVAFVELVNLSHTADPESSFVPGHLIALAGCLLCVLLFGLSALVQCISLRGREDLNLTPARVALVLYGCEAPLLLVALVLLVRR